MDEFLKILPNLSGFAALLVAVATLLNLKSATRKNKGDAVEAISAAAVNVVNSVSTRLDELEKQLADAAKKTADLVSELDATKVLVDRLRAENETLSNNLVNLEKQYKAIINAVRCNITQQRKIAVDPNNHWKERMLAANDDLEKTIDEIE